MQSELIKNFIITGSNRGLGFTLVRLLLERAIPHNIILTARDTEKFQDKFLKLQEKYPTAKLFLHQLDVSNKESVGKFSAWFGENHKTLDILVNNAGVGIKEDIYATKMASEEVAKNTLSTNVYGLIQITQALLPYLAPNGKIVNVSSIMGSLEKHDPKIKAKLLDSNLTTESLIVLAQDYENQIKARQLDGWAISAYAVSKSLVTAYTRIALRKVLKEGQLAMAVHPGWCRTDMGGPQAMFSDEEGADKIYYAMFNAGEDGNFKLYVDNKIYEEK